MTTSKISGKVLNPDEIRELEVGNKTIQVSDAYNQCNRCDSIQLSVDEMHWQDTSGDGVWHDHMQGYDAVCDECFHKLKKDNKQ